MSTLFISFIVPLFMLGLSKNIAYFHAPFLILIPLTYLVINNIHNNVFIVITFIMAVILPLLVSIRLSDKRGFDYWDKKLFDTISFIVLITVLITIYFVVYGLIVAILKCVGNVPMLNVISYLLTFVLSIFIGLFIKKRYVATIFLTITFSVILVTNFLSITSWMNFVVNLAVACFSILLIYLLEKCNSKLTRLKSLEKEKLFHLTAKELFFYFLYILIALTIVLLMTYFFKYGYKGDMVALYAYIIFISSYFLLTKLRFFKVFIFCLYLILAFIISFESFNLVTNIIGCLLGAGGAVLYSRYIKEPVT